VDADEAARRFVGFAVWLKRSFRAELSRVEGGLSEERFRCLLYLAESSGSGLSRLSERIHISSSSLCIMLKKLEEDSYVERRRGTVDRRQVEYRITADGRERLEEERDRRLAVFSGRLATIPPDDQRRLVAAMDTIQAVLQREGPPPRT
jgi:DNA-binding MarR family transcriptional regulator